MTMGTPVDLAGARKVAPFAPDLLQTTDHHLCSGCGHPVAWRLLVEVLDELAWSTGRSASSVTVATRRSSRSPTSSSCSACTGVRPRSPPG